ncbi:uncharacterized protein [Rutidosis leptorrhynchoides]|uniref:uncharacterized protein n=1 Tax=Rutidosis leptorrhynchoides TaxID=125765 RepID=UPI003A999FFD
MLLRCSSTPILHSSQPIQSSPLTRTHSVSFISNKNTYDLHSNSTIKKNARDECSKMLQMSTIGGNGGCGNGGKLCVGGGNGSNGGSDHGHNDTELYYQNMMEANPGNALLLANYAKFLKEVRYNHKKAEEYYERAILANPNDGNVLSMYADLIWQDHRDGNRAESYFNQAIEADPHDCCVLASYARFLWDVEDDDEEDISAINRNWMFNTSTSLIVV